MASKPAEPILSALSERVIGALEWPNYRSQRWGAEHASFVRPVRWICALLGESVVPVTYADVTSSNVTRGHRLLGAGEHVVASPAAYVDVLREAGVLLEDERRERILAGIAEVEAERGGAHVDTPKRIFDEVVNLCEWPTVLVGTFDEEFLDVPSEIICESMLSNQRYFPIYDAEGKLTREFVVVSNSDPRNNERVIDGNERVVRARLDDAKFFYEEDLKQPLESYVEKLKSVVFQEKLGIETEFLNPFTNLSVAGNLAEDSVSLFLMAPSAGLALRAGVKCPVEISLIPQTIVEERRFRRRLPVFAASAVGLLLAMVCWILYTGRERARFEDDTEKLKGEINVLKQYRSQLGGAVGEADAASARVAGYSAIANSRASFAMTIDEIRRALLPGMWITALEFNPKAEVAADEESGEGEEGAEARSYGTVVLTARAFTREVSGRGGSRGSAGDALLHALCASPVFSKGAIRRQERIKGNQVTEFEISLDLARPLGRPDALWVPSEPEAAPAEAESGDEPVAEPSEDGETESEEEDEL